MSGLKYLGVCVALLLMAGCSVDYHFDQLEKSYKLNKTMFVELRDVLVNLQRRSGIRGIVLAPAYTSGRTILNLSGGDEVLFDEAIASRFKEQQNELRRIKEIGKDLGVEYANLDNSASLWITTRGGGPLAGDYGFVCVGATPIETYDLHSFRQLDKESCWYAFAG